jgi:hypothetical protein
MADQPSKTNKVATFFGSLGAILIFALVIYVAYLPNRPEPIDAQANAERLARAEEATAQGIAKISDYAVAADGSIQIPVEEAMQQVLREYRD